MSTAQPQPRLRTMSAMRRPTSTSSTTSASARSRVSLGGSGSGNEQVSSPRSGLAFPRPRSSLSMIERPAVLAARGGRIEQSASGMARPSPLSSTRPLPPAGRSTSGGTKQTSLELVGFGEGDNPAADMLESALKREEEEKENLMVRLANRDEAIQQLEARITQMSTTMTQGESRLAELYADQERWEAERAALEKEITKKTTVIDKLRIQLRELEKENRDYTRRLTEQAAQFESERQAFYDNTAHLKSRIQSLTDQQRDWKEARREEAEEELKEEAPETETETETGEPGEHEPSAEEAVSRRVGRRTQSHKRSETEAGEPAEMTALRLELSTLNTSHSSLGQTVKMLQGQLGDLQRVNMALQEENEAFTTLLREKTLSGQMDILRRGSRSPSPAPLEDEQAEENKDTGMLFPTESRPPRARTQSRAVKPHRNASPARSAHSVKSGKSGRSARRAAAETLAAETLADLPVAGPGLDLAAELGRAEIRLEDDLVQEQEPETKQPEPVKVPDAESEGLKAEIKQLKEENKALALYASKIIDRIISQEGFEHILAVDYGKPKEKPAPPPQPKGFLARAASLSISSPSAPVIGTRPPLKISTSSDAAVDGPGMPLSKRERRGLSMDWSRLNPFARGPSTPVEDVRTSGLKPLALGKTMSAPSPVKEEPKVIVGGRKLDNYEDEEDRVERERLNAEMKLMGIERTPNIHTPSAAVTSFGAAGSALAGGGSGTSTPGLGWGKRGGPGNRVPTGELRAEHLELDDAQSEIEVREVESRLAALEQREKHLSAELAKGKGGGFTEAPARGTRVRRRTNSGSGASTLFSAGRASHTGSEIGIEEEAD